MLGQNVRNMSSYRQMTSLGLQTKPLLVRRTSQSYEEHQTRRQHFHNPCLQIVRLGDSDCAKDLQLLRPFRYRLIRGNGLKRFPLQHFWMLYNMDWDWNRSYRWGGAGVEDGGRYYRPRVFRMPSVLYVVCFGIFDSICWCSFCLSR